MEIIQAGMTALMLAAQAGSYDVVPLLIDNGVDLEAKDEVRQCMYVRILLCGDCRRS